MKLEDKFAIISLNSLEVNHLSKLKRTCLNAIFACKVYLEKGLWPDKNYLKKNIDNYSEFEKSLVSELINDNLLRKTNSIYSLDYVFEQATEDIVIYEADGAAYQKIIDEIKSHLLELESYQEKDLFLIWLLKETDLISSIFSKFESNKMDYLIELSLADKPLLAGRFSSHLVAKKTKLFNRFILSRSKNKSNNYYKGLSYIMPVFYRKKAIFIRTENRFVRKDERLEDLFQKLDERSISYKLVRDGHIPLVQIHNKYYQVVPYVINMYRFATYGSQLREVTL